jgi:hypothetical protein
MSNLPYSSRSLDYLEPEFLRRTNLLMQEYQVRYPNEAQPFIYETYRSPRKQNDLYAQGRDRPGNIVTHNRGGESYHNLYPSLAFDMAFNIPASLGGPWSRKDLFEKFAAIASELDMEWGGNWTRLIDRPHFQVPRYSIKKALEGTPIDWKPLPSWAQTTESVFKVDVPFERVFLVSEDNKSYELDLRVVNIVGNKLYIKTNTTFFIPEE